jgi:hypothetical protein
MLVNDCCPLIVLDSMNHNPISPKNIPSRVLGMYLLFINQEGRTVEKIQGNNVNNERKFWWQKWEILILKMEALGR